MYIGTTTVPEKAMLAIGRHLEKCNPRVQKIKASTRRPVERLCDIRIYALSV